jgi:hypothetical protein
MKVSLDSWIRTHALNKRSQENNLNESDKEMDAVKVTKNQTQSSYACGKVRIYSEDSLKVYFFLDWERV